MEKGLKVNSTKEIIALSSITENGCMCGLIPDLKSVV